MMDGLQIIFSFKILRYIYLNEIDLRKSNFWSKLFIVVTVCWDYTVTL